MMVYRVDPQDGDRALYFATKREAVAFARKATRDIDGEIYRDANTIDVERVALIHLTKTAIVRLLNVDGGYEANATVVAQFPIQRNGDPR